MLIREQKKHFYSLNKWFACPLGLHVAREFSEHLDNLKDFLQGETLLQLGGCRSNRWLEHLDFKRKWIASPYTLSEKLYLECSLNQIPLQRNSIDCVIAPLTLEPFDNSLSLIDEIDRIIKPMGFVILLSINPWGLWGGAMKCGFLSCYANHHVKMHSAFQMNRIFLQRGYRQRALDYFCYIPPLSSESLIKKFTFFDEIGKMLWPFPSGLYCYIAQKYDLISPYSVNKTQVVIKKYKPPLQPAIN